MRAVIAIVALFGCVVDASAQSVGRGCPPYRTAIKLNFTTDSAPTAYSNDYNVTGIQNIMRRKGHVIAGMHQRALGITSSELALSIQGQTVADPVPGGYCVYLRSVDVKFGFRAMDVFIASEYRPQSCEHRVILDHENQHVAINREGLREYAPRVRHAIERHLQGLRPRLTADAQVSTDRKLQDVHDAVDPLLGEMERVLARRNAVIDNANNYNALAEMCKNWDQGNIWPPVQQQKN
jgi:hypothetical protein